MEEINYKKSLMKLFASYVENKKKGALINREYNFQDFIFETYKKCGYNDTFHKPLKKITDKDCVLYLMRKLSNTNIKFIDHLSSIHNTFSDELVIYL